MIASHRGSAQGKSAGRKLRSLTGNFNVLFCIRSLAELSGSERLRSLVIRSLVFLLGRFLDCHVVKFFRIEDIATFQALNIFGVFVAGNNSNPWVFAGGNHRFG